MTAVVFDTNVISGMLLRKAPQHRAHRLDGYEQRLTFATVGELTEWSLTHRWGPNSRAWLRDYLDRSSVLRYDRRVARLWGELHAAARMRGRPQSANDTWIAACCIVSGLPLLTYNTKDFQDFADHHGLVLIA